MNDAAAASPPASPADWSDLVRLDSDWSWRKGKLVHRLAAKPSQPQTSSIFRRTLVRYVYATQNSSPTVRRTLNSLLSRIGPNEWGLNLGAGGTRLHSRILNLDVFDSSGIDVVTSGQKLPFKDNSLSLVVSQEVLEHLPDPPATVAEVHRVLAPGGKFYCQIPFIIGYHPGPTDFWRFTREGLRELFAEPNWIIDEMDISLGHGSGFYRIAVEYVAVNFSLISNRFYLPAKAAAAIGLLPLKWPDLLSQRSPQKDRIPGGYYCVARKL